MFGIASGKIGAECSKNRSKIINFPERCWVPAQPGWAAAQEAGRPLRIVGRPLRVGKFYFDFYNPYSVGLLRWLVLVSFYISSSQRCFKKAWYQARSKERRKKTILAHRNEEEEAYIFLWFFYSLYQWMLVFFTLNLITLVTYSGFNKYFY